MNRRKFIKFIAATSIIFSIPIEPFEFATGGIATAPEHLPITTEFGEFGDRFVKGGGWSFGGVESFTFYKG